MAPSSAWRTQLRSLFVVQPIFDAIEPIAARCAFRLTRGPPQRIGNSLRLTSHPVSGPESQVGARSSACGQQWRRGPGRAAWPRATQTIPAHANEACHDLREKCRAPVNPGTANPKTMSSGSPSDSLLELGGPSVYKTESPQDAAPARYDRTNKPPPTVRTLRLAAGRIFERDGRLHRLALSFRGRPQAEEKGQR